MDDRIVGQPGAAGTGGSERNRYAGATIYGIFFDLFDIYLLKVHLIRLVFCVLVVI